MSTAGGREFLNFLHPSLLPLFFPSLSEGRSDVMLLPFIRLSSSTSQTFSFFFSLIYSSAFSVLFLPTAKLPDHATNYSCFWGNFGVRSGNSFLFALYIMSLGRSLNGVRSSCCFFFAGPLPHERGHAEVRRRHQAVLQHALLPRPPERAAILVEVRRNRFL